MCNECRHIMPSGVKCHAPALSGKPYCYFHTRLHGLAERPAPAPEEPLKLPILEDRSSIQIALTLILDGLSSSQLDPKRAGLLLYGLQIASQNVDRKRPIVSISSVHSISQTPEGDDLGPEKRICPFPSHCDQCDVSEGCEDYEPEEDDDDDEEN
jgi:hypothetical protein